jgi:hypothetical protein
MLRPKPQLNLQNAREYFREHLCVGDYYSEGQKVTESGSAQVQKSSDSRVRSARRNSWPCARG